MTISGENEQKTIINSNGNNTIFNIIYGTNLTIERLTLTNGSRTIENQGTLTVNNCLFLNNTEAIYNLNAPSIITNTTFANNNNAISNIFSSSISTITGCNFLNNGGSDGCNGGAIDNAFTTLTITNCSFTNNTAPYGLGRYRQ